MLNSVVLTGKTPGAWSGLVPELRLDRLAVSAVAPEIGSPTYKSLEFGAAFQWGKQKERHGVGTGLLKGCCLSLLSINNSSIEKPTLKVGHPRGPLSSFTQVNSSAFLPLQR